MRFAKFFTALGLSTLVFSQVNAAAITELNNQNAAQCRKQIMSARTPNVVVSAYYAECHWWQNFQPNYVSVANSLNFPAAYFQFDFLAAAPGVAANCLQMQPRYSPTILVYAKNKKGYSLSRSIAGYKNTRDLAKFITK